MGKLVQYSTIASKYDGPFDDKSGWEAAGMGYFIITDSEKIIVVDGGFEEDAQNFISTIKSKIKKEKIIIDIWIITHPHRDHYGVISEISNNQKLINQVNIKKIIYYYPMDFFNSLKEKGVLKEENNKMELICKKLKAIVYQPKYNEKIQVDNTEIHFLYVPDDCSFLNDFNGNYNQCSLIFTIKGENKKIMFTGDAYYRTLQLVAWRFPNQIKCNFLQMPHHGLCDTGNLDFYKEVKPDVLLIPISIAGNRAMHSIYLDSPICQLNIELENSVDKIFKAFEGTIELEI